MAMVEVVSGLGSLVGAPIGGFLFELGRRNDQRIWAESENDGGVGSHRSSQSNMYGAQGAGDGHWAFLLPMLVGSVLPFVVGLFVLLPLMDNVFLVPKQRSRVLEILQEHVSVSV